MLQVMALEGGSTALAARALRSCEFRRSGRVTAAEAHGAWVGLEAKGGRSWSLS